MKKTNQWIGLLLVLIMALSMPISASAATTYEGTGAGNNGKITVAVGLEDGTIVSVDVTDHGETAGICDLAITTVPADIVTHQSIAVDAVSGATNTSKGILEAVGNALTAAGLDLAMYSKPIEKEATQAVHTELFADVVIVGGGGAGLAATVSATDEGASVIVLEKTSRIGGNTLASGGIYNCPNPELMKSFEMSANYASLIEAALAEEPVSEAHKALMDAVRAEFEAYVASGSTALFDSANWYALQTWNGGDKLAKLELVETLANQSYDGLNWLKGMGMGFTDRLKQGAGSLYPRTHTSVDLLGTGYFKTYTSYLESGDADYTIMLNTTGDSLIQKDGKVVGIEAHDKDGNTYSVYANKSVILATGGFSGNVELRQKYNTSGKWADLSTLPTTNMPGITGDGIIMAEAIGANLVNMDQIQLLHGGNVKDGSTNGITARCQSADFVVFVNEQGKRFVREDGRRDEICGALLNQTNTLMYIIESADDGADSIETGILLDGTPLMEAAEKGDIYIADTLEELAGKIGCDPAALIATIDEYNAMVDAQVDLVTGRTMLEHKLLTGPFIATPRVPSVHHTMGGIDIDTMCHVLDGNGAIIDGLLAAGEVTGGIHGGNRLGGNALVDAVIFGRIAGKTATNAGN